MFLSNARPIKGIFLYGESDVVGSMMHIIVEVACKNGSEVYAVVYKPDKVHFPTELVD